MSEKIVVARNGMDLGSLLPAEAAELLQAGFLKPTDSWRWENSDTWRPLGQLPQEPTPASLTKRLQTKLTEAAHSAATGATQITAKLKSWVGQGQNQLTLSSRQMLEGFVPQLQKLVAHQLIQQPIASVRVAFADDEFMRKFFGAVYDCLPRPVCRFIAEDVFIEFCLERKELLFKETNTANQLNPPGSENSTMKTIAIIGASTDRNKFGNKAVRAFQQQGYQVFPVNPKEETIEGLRAYKSITDVPVRPDKISVYLPPPVLLKVLPDIAAKGCDEFWLNPGTESDEVLATAEQLGLNVIQACSIVGVGISPEAL
jgi:predicted CoA-binding protein